MDKVYIVSSFASASSDKWQDDDSIRGVFSTEDAARKFIEKLLCDDRYYIDCKYAGYDYAFYYIREFSVDGDIDVHTVPRTRFIREDTWRVIFTN